MPDGLLGILEIIRGAEPGNGTVRSHDISRKCGKSFRIQVGVDFVMPIVIEAFLK